MGLFWKKVKGAELPDPQYINADPTAKPKDIWQRWRREYRCRVLKVSDHDEARDGLKVHFWSRSEGLMELRRMVTTPYIAVRVGSEDLKYWVFVPTRHGNFTHQLTDMGILELEESFTNEQLVGTEIYRAYLTDQITFV